MAYNNNFIKQLKINKMKTIIQINGNPVEIELTKEQVAHIKKQSTDFRDIKTFEDACAFLGIDAHSWRLSFAGLPDHVRAYMMLCVICEALNGGEIMSYVNASVYKYYPLFNAKGSNEGFSHDSYVGDHSYSLVGSRLCLKSAEIAQYVGKQFIDIYNIYING